MNLPRNTCSWKLAGTTTFRLASSKLPDGRGTNLQNPSKNICAIYIPDDGKVFVQCDQSGAEALVVAYLCRPGKFRELFQNGIKSHVYVALHLFAPYWRTHLESPLSPEEFTSRFLTANIAALKLDPLWKTIEGAIKKHDKYYALGKMVCHASNYGMKPGTFRLNVLQKSGGKISLSAKEAEVFLNTYHSLFPEIEDWHRATQQQLYRARELRNLFGYPRRFTHAMNEDFWKEAYSFVPQSTVGTITNIALVRMQQHIEDMKLTEWDLLNNKHDSYLLQCPVEDVKEASAKMQEFINQDLVAPDGTRFKMASETQVGNNWAFKE